MKRVVLALLAGLMLVGCGQAPSQGQVSTSDVTAAASEAVYQTYTCQKSISSLAPCGQDNVILTCQLNWSKTGLLISSSCNVATGTNPTGFYQILSATMDPVSRLITIKTNCSAGQFDFVTYFMTDQDCIKPPNPVT